MDQLQLPGRFIEDIPYSGLVERLLQASLACTVAGEAKDDLSNDDMLSIIATIASCIADGLAFSCATDAELLSANQHVMTAAHVSREAPQ